MRLIDADELVKAIENENSGISISGAVEKFARIAQVNMQPTVEAIPITWINTWLNTGRNAKYFIHMMELIKEWEEENGRSE